MKKFLFVFGLTTAGALASASNALAAPCDCRIPQAVPEPATWAMLIVGIAAVGLASRLRKRAGQPA